MEFNPDTSQREYRFGSIDKATQELNKLGFLLDDSIPSKEIYHVIPVKIQDDYPRMNDGRTPRFVAVLDSKGTLIFDKPFDNNHVLIRYQTKLEKLIS